MRNPFIFEFAPVAAEIDFSRSSAKPKSAGRNEFAFETGSAGGTFRAAGRRTTSRVDGKTAGLIQNALAASPSLGALLAAPLRKTPVARNFIHYGSDAEFTHVYKKLNRIAVPFNSAAEKSLLSVRGFYHRPTDAVHLRPAATLGLAVRLTLARLSSPAFRGAFGDCLTDALALYFANLVLREQGLEAIKPGEYAAPLASAEDLIAAATLPRVAQAYFQSPAELFHHLRTKLDIGPVGGEELAGGALCRTKLLRTAVFASRQLKNMVGVGMTWSRAARLWLRADVPGAHELQIAGGKGGVKKIDLTVPVDSRSDKTLAVTYPAAAGQTPLEPLTRYRFRVVRKSDGTPLGEGSFETAPALDAATPEKVVIGVMSCHQPFTNRGAVGAEQARVMRLLPRILRENEVKFMLLAGDQIYSDYPSDFSLFDNPYLIRRIAPGKKSIFECTTDEVRRIYDMRYRIFWSMPPIRQMYANYPCYPAMDDHEITDDWGSMPEHATARYRHIRDGARLAYMDYQASSVLPPARALPKSFHYQFAYGNVGVFVMDIRSERMTGARHQLYGDEQLNDLRLFLEANAAKKVLLIVSSVPVVHLGGWLTDLGHRITGPDVDFLDQWSFKKNIPARDAFLSLLHRHQQAHPAQRVAIVSGDVHISSAFSINWRGGNKPRLYQFTSSAVTNPLKGWRADFSKIGPNLLTGIDCRQTKFGGACSGSVGLLPAAQSAPARNPLAELNLGLIEIRRRGGESNLKFKLVGAHPTEDRPLTYFESGWLG